MCCQPVVMVLSVSQLKVAVLDSPDWPGWCDNGLIAPYTLECLTSCVWPGQLSDILSAIIPILWVKWGGSTVLRKFSVWIPHLRIAISMSHCSRWRNPKGVEAEKIETRHLRPLGLWRFSRTGVPLILYFRIHFMCAWWLCMCFRENMVGMGKLRRMGICQHLAALGIPSVLAM